MDRSTLTITLPKSKATVCLYEYLTNGDFRQIQSKMLESVKINIKEAQDNPQNTMSEIPANIAIVNQDTVTKLLIKSITDAEGNVVTDLDQFIYNLTIEDGRELYRVTEEISQKSQLDETSKKK